MTRRKTVIGLLAAVFSLSVVGGFLLPIVPMIAGALLVMSAVAATAAVVMV